MTHRHEPGSPECMELLGQLSDYLDDELPADACRHLEEHLEDCPPCVAFLESLRRTVALVRSDPRPEIPQDLRRRIVNVWRRSQENPDA
jgi:anti-sigma factor (TIGR02949 family)